MPEKKTSGYRAQIVKSRVPTTPNAQVGFEPQSASLEGLAFELKFEILQRLTDLPSLDAIVHASPSYHRAHVTRRHSILAKVVSRDIGPNILLEAHALAMALTTNNKDGSEIRRFLEEYKSTRTEPASVSIERFPLTHIATLSRVQYAVRFASKDFCQATLSRHPLSSEKEEDIPPLSTNEARRINRAFYRFEIFCTIFSQPGFKVKRKLDCMDMCHLFLNQFPPWEVEEIACIRDYIIGRYAQLFAKHEHELPRHPSQGPPEDSSGDDMPFEDIMLEHYQERCMSHGLSFLRRISQASTFEQVRMLRKNLIDTHFFLTRTLEEEPYDYVYRTNAFDDWVNKLPLRFVDDCDGPNAAWTWSNGDMVELFPFQPSKENPRKRGYVMWDKERLDRWGVLESSNEEYVRQCYE